jgi:two-component system phosphate regulon response regulator PhoB/two-component system alkaline phosphatase synthesis response regulator PhoP
LTITRTVAIVDDEPDLCELVSVHLKRAGFQTQAFLEGRTFLKYLDRHRPDLVILDLMLPDADGFEICKHLRSNRELASLPVIILTAKGDETDRVLGLELGADDYITKPFSVKELVARVKAVLRRLEAPQAIQKVEIGKVLAIDLEKHKVLVDGREIELTSTEFKILGLLALNRGRVFTRDQILDHLWGQEKVVVDRTIDVHIRNLREKLGKAAPLVKNIRGVGYKIEE